MVRAPSSMTMPTSILVGVVRVAARPPTCIYLAFAIRHSRNQLHPSLNTCRAPAVAALRFKQHKEKLLAWTIRPERPGQHFASRRPTQQPLCHFSACEFSRCRGGEICSAREYLLRTTQPTFFSGRDFGPKILVQMVSERRLKKNSRRIQSACQAFRHKPPAARLAGCGPFSPDDQKLLRQATGRLSGRQEARRKVQSLPGCAILVTGMHTSSQHTNPLSRTIASCCKNQAIDLQVGRQ